MPILGKDGVIWTGFIRPVRPFIQRVVLGKTEIPEIAYNWARGVSKITGIPYEEILQSQMFKNYVRRMWGIDIL